MHMLSTIKTQPLIGIDLGTTNSLIAVWHPDGKGAGTVELIKNALGETLTPSAVSVAQSGTLLVGRPAWERRVSHPRETATAFKRSMGSSKVFTIGEFSFGPEDLSALILRSLKADAEAHLGMTVTEAVISVPAYFNETQRRATVNAAKLAGLSVSRLINEPTAAALAYNIHAAKDSSSFLVFDLGGGTFDVSIVELFEHVVEVKATTGDNYLGGEDFTDALAKFIAKKHSASLDSVSPEGIALRARLTAAADRIKLMLSTQAEARASVNLAKDNVVETVVTETDFEGVAAELLTRLREPVERALRDSRLSPNEVDEIVLVGGATRMPVVRKLVTRLFGRFPNISVHPDEAIVIGAATQAGLLATDAAISEVLLTDVCPHTLGVEVSQTTNGTLECGFFSPILERNTVIPASREKDYHPVNKDQDYLELAVYQGEHRLVKDNVSLGTLRVDLPMKVAYADRGVLVRFTYDNNGMLDIDVTVEATKKVVSKTLMGDHLELTEEALKERAERLAALKVHPRDDMQNAQIIARAERLYAELLGSAREAVGHALRDFDAVLNQQDPPTIVRHRKLMTDFLDRIESSPFDGMDS